MRNNSKSFWKKSCAWLLTLATVCSTMSSSISSLYADEQVDTSEVVSQNTPEDNSGVVVTPEGDIVPLSEDSDGNEDVPNEEPPVELEKGSVYVKLNEGGIAIVTYGENEYQTLEAKEGKVTSTDANGVVTDVTSSLLDGYYLVVNKEVGTIVTIEVYANSGYKVSEYRVLADSGEEVDEAKGFASLTDNYRQEISITEGSKYVGVEFVEDSDEIYEEFGGSDNEGEEIDECNDVLGKENVSKYGEVSFKDIVVDTDMTEEEFNSLEDWKKKAYTDPDWVIANGDFLPPEENTEMLKVLKDLSNRAKPSRRFRLLTASAGTTGKISKYNAVSAYGSTVGNFEISTNNSTSHAFCAQHTKTTPAVYHTIPIDVDYKSEITNAMAKKVLYYGYNGPGASVEGNPMQGRSDTEQIVLTSLLLSRSLGNGGGTGSTSNAVWDKLVPLGDAPEGFKAYIWTTQDSRVQELATWENIPKGKVKIHKSTKAGYDCVKGNPLYSLEGAKYGLYSDSACTQLIDILTTDADGNTGESVELDAGTYYVKEISAPSGYSLDTEEHVVNVVAGSTAPVECSDIPMDDPNSIRLLKKENANVAISGAEYTIKYYTNYSFSGYPERTWVFKTNDKGLVNILRDEPINKGEKYKNFKGDPIFLVGSYTVQETKAPKGYKIDPTVYKATISENNNYLWTWSNESITALLAYNSKTSESTVKDEPYAGRIKIIKMDADTESGKPQGKASLAGIKFQIINSTGRPIEYQGKVYDNGKVITTLTTDEKGECYTPKKSLPYGKYTVSEVEGNKFYTCDFKHQSDEIPKDEDDTEVKFIFTNHIKTGGLEVVKVDKDLYTDGKDNITKYSAQGKGSIKATFSIINNNEKAVLVKGESYKKGKEVAKITTKLIDGKYVARTGEHDLPVGDYIVKEVAVDGHYLLTDGTERYATITEHGEICHPKDYVFKNEIIKGGARVAKVDKDTGSGAYQGDAVLFDAEFTVYSNNDNPVDYKGKIVKKDQAVMVIKTGFNLSLNKYIAETGVKDLPYGDYYIKETKAPKGYKLNKDYIGRVSIRENGKIVDAEDFICENSVIRGGLSIQKVDVNTGKTPQGNATLKGAEFKIINISDYRVVVNGVTYEPGQVVMTLVTDEKGVATTGNEDLPYGTYRILETKAPEGMLVNLEYKEEVSIRENGKIVPVDTRPCEDQPIRGGIKLSKLDKLLNRSNAEGDGSLEGAEFSIYNKSTHPVYVDGKIYGVNACVKVIKTVWSETDKEYIASTNADCLPYGDYLVVETKAPKGYDIDKDFKFEPKIRVNGKILDSGVKASDPILLGSISIQKVDKDLKRIDPQGNATLEGAKFRITNKSEQVVKVNGKEYLPNAEVMVITTDKNGYAETPISSLPYGTYGIEEIEPSNGYLVATDYKKKVEVHGEEHVTYDIDKKSIDCAEPVIRGGVKLVKKDANLNRSEVEGDGTLAGARFGIYNTSEHSVWVDGREYKKGDKVKTIMSVWSVTDNAFIAQTGDHDLPYGSYYVKEEEPSLGYKLDTSFNESFEIKKDGEVVKLAKSNDEPIIKGSLSVQKYDSNYNFNKPQGDATLEGAKFQVINSSQHLVKVDGKEYKPGEVVTVIITNSLGYAKTPDNYLPYGTYTLKEITPPTGYLLSTSYSDVEAVHVEGLVSAQKICIENVIRGGVKIQKDDRLLGRSAEQGDATLVGAIYGIYNESSHAVWVDGKEYAVGTLVKTIQSKWSASDGAYIAETASDSLPYGSYYIKELKPSTGYNLDAEFEEHFKIRTHGKVEFIKKHSTEPVQMGSLSVQKYDVNYNSNKPQGDGTLAGTVFSITNASKTVVKVNGKEYMPGSVVGTIVTDEKGYASTPANYLPYGTYTVKEVNPPEGYLINNGYVDTVIVHGETLVPAKKICINTPKRGSVKIQKNDEDLKRAYAQGDATLEGAVYSIYNDSKHPVWVEGKEYKVGEVVKQLTTDAKGYAESPKSILPYGTYYVKETKPSRGYNLDVDYKEYFTIREDGEIADLTPASKSSYEPVIRGDVQIQKWDLELSKSEALGGFGHGLTNHKGAHLDGIEFEITNVSAHNVWVDGKEYEPNKVVKTIKTKWSESAKAYVAETTGNCLPYGTYTIRESKTNSSYLFTDKNVYTFTIREQGKCVKVDTNGTTMVYKNQVIRGDVEWVKIADSTSARISAPFIITNVSSGEEHVVVTDRNGQFNTNSSWNKHSTKTNANDWALSKLKEDPTYCFTEDELDDTSGIWFSKGEDGSDAKINDNLGALPYGEYLLTEVKCENNAALKMQQFRFYIYKDGSIVDLGTVTDDAGKPSITTRAVNKATNQHICPNEKELTLVDTVHVVGLVIGEDYTIKGKFTDYNDEGVMVKSNGRAIKGSTTFTATSVVMDVDIEYTFDATKLRGTTGVFFAYLYRAGDLVASEENVECEDQTIWFPDISTKAIDTLTGDEVAVNGNITSIKDTVEYDNLKSGENYVLKGSLVDKATGEVVNTSEVPFTAEEREGVVEVLFNYSGNTEGKTYVVFEELYLDGMLVGTHSDINDEAQTVYFPEINTNAIDSTSETQTGTVDSETTIIDTVKYHNLVVGKEYTVSGVLMDKETNSKLLVDGKEITASKTFTPTKSDGSITLEYVLDSSALAGKSVVVFEDLIYNSIKVATHSDINDADQTIYFPEIATKAKDNNTGDNVAVVGKSTIVDTVSYENLVVGKEYSIVGTLMDKDTKDYLGKDLGLNPIVATTIFTPESASGTVDLVYNVDASKFGGRSIVVFEKLYRGSTIVRSHTDIEDINQTVYLPKIKTNAVTSEGINEGLAEGEQVIVDTVTYENLVVGKEYIINGKLMVKGTGKPLVIDNEEVISTVTFTPEFSNGSIDLSFLIKDASVLAGNTVVAYQDLLHNGITLTTHSDIKDYDQSVKFPKVDTKAIDGKTELDEGLAEDGAVIVDTVSYENLEEGVTYTVKGKLVDKSTGGFLQENGSDIEVVNTFMVGDEASYGSHEVLSGKVKMIFNLDASKLAGKTLVAYEEIYRGDVLIGSHKDIEDEKQDIKYIGIQTEVLGSETGLHEVDTSESTVVVDTVTYSNLTVGNTYTLNAVLMDKASGKELLVNGSKVTATKTFTAENSDGSIDIELPVDTSVLAGQTIVAFERMYNDDKLVAIHTDIEDADQTIYIPEVHTKALDGDTELHEGLVGDKSVLVDTVEYSNLEGGSSYTVKGILYDKETKEPLLVDGEEVVSSVEFTPEGEGRVSGSVNVVFEYSSKELADRGIVAYESIYSGDKLIAHHTDIDDEAQSVYYPDINTEVLDGVTILHEGLVGKDTTIVDTVYYRNLTAGNSYVVKGILYDKDTREPLEVVSGSSVVSTVEFTPEGEGRVSGSIEVPFELDSSELAGKGVVAYEYVYSSDKLVAEHIDIEDENQTVYFPKVTTEALDGKTKLHEGLVGSESVIVDKVYYENLTGGTEYRIKGILYDKDSNEVLKVNEEEIISEITFIPEGEGRVSGEVELLYPFDSSELEGRNIVVYEYVYSGDMLVAEHTDIDDEGQTVHYPKVSTSVVEKEAGIREASPSEATTIVDTLSYSNLSSDTTYTVKGILMSKDSENPTPLLVDGKEVTSTVEFTTGNDGRVSGTVDVPFTFDSSALGGSSVVVYEYVYVGDKLVGKHTDIEDTNQTINFVSIDTLALDDVSKAHQQQANKKGKIIDTVSYKNLTIGNKYTLKGIVYDKKTKKPIVIDGKEVVGETVFEATESTGSVEVVFDINTVGLEGTDLVVFETLYSGDYELANHRDLDDEDQTVRVINIKTKALDKSSGTHMSQIGEKTTIVDEVSYSGLIVGKEYEVMGTLINRDSGMPLTIRGLRVTAKAKFTPEKSEGSVELTYKLDSSALKGMTVVVFEDLYCDDMLVATHSDINDVEQTVNFITIETTALDSLSGTKVMTLGESVELVDIVDYYNLDKNATYTLKGCVVDKATGEVITEGSTTFETYRYNGSAEVLFFINTKNLQNRRLVVFEELYDAEGNLIAVHKDLNDRWQTVSVPTKPPKDNPPKPRKSGFAKTGEYGLLVFLGSGLIGLGTGMVIRGRRKRNKK